MASRVIVVKTDKVIQLLGNKLIMPNVIELCDQIRQVGFDIHVFLGPGHLEKVYENALIHRLRKAGLSVEQQYPIYVYDEDGTRIGEYYADLFVESCLIIELKAVKEFANVHVSQILGYLRATKIRHGLLINFGAGKYQIRKFII